MLRFNLNRKNAKNRENEIVQFDEKKCKNS